MFSVDRPTYAAQDWAHLCTWDYFVGYWIYLQGQDKKVFTRHSLVLAFNSGAAPVLGAAYPSSVRPHRDDEAAMVSSHGGPHEHNTPHKDCLPCTSQELQGTADAPARKELA